MTTRYANPAPLGLMAFGMTTVLLNIHNTGYFPLNASIVAMGLFYGGLAQVIAGILEYQKNNTFGVTAFTSYGFFWITLVGLWLLPQMGMAKPTSPAFMGWFLAAWGTFTGLMFIGTLKFNRVKQFIFASLTVLFFMLAIHNWTGSELVGHLAGWEGIICGLSAVYLAMASVINEVHGKTILPVGEPKSQAADQFEPALAEAA